MQENIETYLQTYNMFHILVFAIPAAFLVVGALTWLYNARSGLWQYVDDRKMLETKKGERKLALAINALSKVCLIMTVVSFVILFLTAWHTGKTQGEAVKENIKSEYAIEVVSDTSVVQKAMLHATKDFDTNKINVKTSERFYDVYLICNEGEYGMYTRNEKGAYIAITPAAVRELQNQ